MTSFYLTSLNIALVLLFGAALGAAAQKGSIGEEGRIRI
jgi:hypothetical protein